MKTVLVTGGAGFIGSHACETLLSEGRRVVSFDNFFPFYDPALKRRNVRDILRHPRARHFTSVRGDIRDPRAVERVIRRYRPSTVVHLAAMAGVRPSIESPLLYEEVNVRGTLVLLEACRKFGVRNFVFASSSSVYGENPKVPFSESDRVDGPISPYAATKKAGELFTHVYHHLFRMNVCALRFFTVYGPRQRPDLAIRKFTRLLNEGRPIPFFGSGATRRDYTYITDIAAGVSKAVRWTERPGRARCGIFNLGESRTISLARMVAEIERATGRRARLRRLPDQPGDVPRTFADLKRSRKILGYRPTTAFPDGVRAFVEWYRRNA